MKPFCLRSSFSVHRSISGLRLSPARIAASGAAFAVATFEDLLAHVLRGGLDFLHFFADARAGGLVPAHRLGDVVLGFGDQAFERLVFVHHGSKPPKGPPLRGSMVILG